MLRCLACHTRTQRHPARGAYVAGNSLSGQSHVPRHATKRQRELFRYPAAMTRRPASMMSWLLNVELVTSNAMRRPGMPAEIDAAALAIRKMRPSFCPHDRSNHRCWSTLRLLSCAARPSFHRSAASAVDRCNWVRRRQVLRLSTDSYRCGNPTNPPRAQRRSREARRTPRWCNGWDGSRLSSPVPALNYRSPCSVLGP